MASTKRRIDISENEKEKRSILLVFFSILFFMGSLLCFGLYSLYSIRRAEIQQTTQLLIKNFIRNEEQDLAMEIFLEQMGAYILRAKDLETRLKGILETSQVCIRNHKNKLVYAPFGCHLPFKQVNFDFELKFDLKEGTNQVGQIIIRYRDPTSLLYIIKNYKTETTLVISAFFILLFLLWILLSVFIQRVFRKITQAEKEAFAVDLAKQLSHDIKSPVAVVQSIIKGLPQIDDESRSILISATSRIAEMSKQMLQNFCTLDSDEELQSNSDETRPCLLLATIEDIALEKRRGLDSNKNVILHVDVCEDSYNLFSNINPIKLKRILSNLLDNSIQAIPKNGQIKLTLDYNENHNVISVIDSGTGIPPAILKKLGKKGVTSKPSGKGLGVFMAKKTIDSWGGKLEIHSNKKGTAIKISLPISSRTQWFVPEIDISSRKSIVILDDDQCILKFWRERLSHISKNPVYTFNNSASFLSFFKEINPNSYEQFLFIMDYHLTGDSINGLDLIESCQIAKSSILVTSLHDDIDLLDRCSKLGCGFIAKSIVSYVQLKTDFSSFDAVLLDDDPYLQKAWQRDAQRKGKRLALISSPSEWLNIRGDISKNTPIYLDSNLGKEISGEEFAKKIYLSGYSNLHLATGYDPDEFNHIPWIKTVGGKLSPWH